MTKKDRYFALLQKMRDNTFTSAEQDEFIKISTELFIEKLNEPEVTAMLKRLRYK